MTKLNALKTIARTTNTLSATALAAVLLTSGLTGCTMGDFDGTGDDVQGNHDGDSKIVLGLGYSDGGDTVLDRLGDHFAVLSRDELGLDQPKLTIQEARLVLADIHGVVIDLAEVNDDELDQWSPIFRAALPMHVPMLIENADDADRMAKVIGVGVEADLAYVTSDGERYNVQVFGDQSAVSEQAAHEVVERLSAYERPHSYKTSDAIYVYDVDFTTSSWNIDSSGQTATANMDFEIQLIADQDIDRKYAQISQSGGGFHPGSLLSDSSTARGYYTDSVEVSIDSLSSSLSLYQHAPETSTSSSTYQSSTGWNVGYVGSNIVFQYSSSSVVSTTLDDFSTINDTAGNDPAWKWELSKELYYHNLLDTCKMYDLPDKAKYNITPEFEAIFKASSGFDSTASFKFTTKANVNYSTAGGSIFSCTKGTDSGTLTRSKTVSVDFSKVSVD